MLKTKELSKLSAKSKQCVLVGYETGARAYRLWDRDSRKIIVSRNVTFNERLFPFLTPNETTVQNFEIDDLFTFPKHDACIHRIPETHTSATPSRRDVSQTPFPNTEPDLMTFCRDRSTISQQFPHYLPSPAITSSDPPRIQRRLSIISLSTSSSPNTSIPSSPSSPPLPNTLPIEIPEITTPSHSRTAITRHQLIEKEKEIIKEKQREKQKEKETRIKENIKEIQKEKEKKKRNSKRKRSKRKRNPRKQLSILTPSSFTPTHTKQRTPRLPRKPHRTPSSNRQRHSIIL